MAVLQSVVMLALAAINPLSPGDHAGIHIVPSRNGTGAQIEDASVRYALDDHTIRAALEIDDERFGDTLFGGFRLCE